MSYNVKVDTLREGEFYNVSVTATNMIGPSETFQTSFTVNSKMSSENNIVQIYYNMQNIYVYFINEYKIIYIYICFPKNKI